MPVWRIAALLAALAGYALLSHGLMVHAPAHPWTVAALFGPLLAGLALAGWQRRHMPSLLLCALAAAVLAVVVARGGVADAQRLYVLQHSALHAVGAWTFAITLRPGAQPLITALAERVHEQFTPAMRAYTRRLTTVWAMYFVVMIGISFALYLFAPWEAWSVFCNLVTPLAVGALFVGDHLFRHWRHPEFERVTLARAVRAWRSHGAAQAR